MKQYFVFLHAGNQTVKLSFPGGGDIFIEIGPNELQKEQGVPSH